MQMRKIHCLTVSCACALASVSAEAALKALDIGVQGANVSGAKSQSYNGKLGFNFAAYSDQPALNPNVAFLGGLDYQAFGLAGFADGRLGLLDLTGGIVVHGAGAWGISPRFAVQAGATYAWLGYPDSAVTTQNSKVYATAKFSPGFDFKVYDSVALGVRLPVQLVFAKPMLTLFSQSLVLRWNL